MVKAPPGAALVYRAGLDVGLLAYGRLSSAWSAAFMQAAPQTISPKEPRRQCDIMKKVVLGIRLSFVGSWASPFSSCIILSEARIFAEL